MSARASARWWAPGCPSTRGTRLLPVIELVEMPPRTRRQAHCGAAQRSRVIRRTLARWPRWRGSAALRRAQGPGHPGEPLPLIEAARPECPSTGSGTESVRAQASPVTEPVEVPTRNPSTGSCTEAFRVHLCRSLSLSKCPRGLLVVPGTPLPVTELVEVPTRNPSTGSGTGNGQNGAGSGSVRWCFPSGVVHSRTPPGPWSRFHPGRCFIR